jgi:hypothetical protein
MVMLHRLPADKKRRNGWIRQLQNVRANLIINDNTRICSVHFVNADSSNLPTLFPSKPHKEVKCRRLLNRQITGISDCTRTAASLSEECADALLNLPKPNHIICTKCRSDVETRDIGVQHQESTVTVGTQSSFPDLVIEDLYGDDSKVRFYTGFICFKMLAAMFHTLVVHGADRLNYWRGEHSVGDRVYHESGNKPGPKRILRLEDEFLLTCMRLRLGLLQVHLGDIFKISESTVSRILTTWINFIYDCSKELIPWPSKEKLLYKLPRAFMDFPNTQIVLDCTEIFIEKPSSQVAQWQTWSDYKHNTVKLLIGVTPNGTVNFVSRLWGGRASDRHITMNEGIIARIDPGMVIMADKGFTIEDLLPENIHLNMPPKIPSARPMSDNEVFRTQHIASARIVVEMKMEQAKNYRCLQGIIPLSESHLVEQMAFICFAWTNLLPPLFKK